MTPGLAWLSAALTLAAPLWASPRARQQGPALYSAASAQWSAALQAPLAGFSGAAGPLAAVAALPDADRARSLGPVVRELQRGLRLDAERFAALDPDDQRTALASAAEQAQTTLTQRAYELVAQTKALGWSKQAVDREGLKSLYVLASTLQELRGYGVFLDEHDVRAVADAAARASARYREARADYIERYGLRVAGALGRGRDPSPEPVAQAAATAPRPTPRVIEPSTAARKLLERMRETKVGWGEKDVETVYVGHGFTYRDGAKHRVYSHPDFPHLRTSVSRQTELKPAYVREAIRLIEQALALGAPAGLPVARPASAHAAAASQGAGLEEDALPPLPPAPVSKPPVSRSAPKLELAAQPLSPQALAPEPEEKPAAPPPRVEPQPAAPATPAPTPADAAAPAHAQPEARSAWRRLLDWLRKG